LTNNRIWKQRLVDIGIINYKNVLDFGFSGVMLRGSGISWDLRKNASYDIYNKIPFYIPLGKNGDCYDRYLIRINEMRESLRIIYFCINNIQTGDIKTNDYKITVTARGVMKYSMESLINHFKLYTEGYTISNSEIYKCIEAPKGEFGVYLVADNTNRP